jgi:hypothetical protein
MSRSLWTIAELVWRQINPPGTDEAKNTLEEYVERAKDEYANVAFNTWLQLRNDSDLSIVEQLLVRKKYDVKQDAEGLFSELDHNVLDFPRDMGVFKVQPPKQRPMTKTTLGTMDLYKGDPGEKVYYRIGKKIFYPEGFDNPATKDVMITIVASDFIDDDLQVPEIFAKPIQDALMKAYGSTIGVKEDLSNNQKAD